MENKTIVNIHKIHFIYNIDHLLYLNNLYFFYNKSQLT
jgi:hypothetical protein